MMPAEELLKPGGIGVVTFGYKLWAFLLDDAAHCAEFEYYERTSLIAYPYLSEDDRTIALTFQQQGNDEEYRRQYNKPDERAYYVGSPFYGML